LGTRRASRAGARLALAFGVLWGSALYLKVRGNMKYKIAIHDSDEGFSVSVPGLPGCWSQGATEQEALDNIRDAIREYLAVVNEQLRGEEVREVEITV
jgi:predicted RNase H-like HicB family nuclease